MAYQFAPYGEEHVALVKQLNVRMASSGNEFPESPIPKWLPKIPGLPIYQEYYVCLNEDGSKVHGAYIWKHQPFHLLGDELVVVDLQLPISEGVVDRQHASLGAEILMRTLAEHPDVYALGMGGRREPVARLFKAARFEFVDCPLFFKVLRPFRFLTRMAYLRKRRWIRVLADLVALSGVGSIVIPALHAFLKLCRGGRRSTSTRSRIISGFAPDVYDTLYECCKHSYAFMAKRTAEILNRLYPADDPRFHRIEVLQEDRVVGFAVIMANCLDDEKYFGRLRLGSVVDCLALPGYEDAVIAHAEESLRLLNADLIVSNQLHCDWLHAFRNNGYLTFTSNYALAVSPKLANKLAPFDENALRIHMTRGDGDGPIHI